MKKWQKRKLRDELICLAVALVGIIMVLMHMFDMCPWIAWIGGYLAVSGLFVFVDVRKKKYSPKRKNNSEETR